MKITDYAALHPSNALAPFMVDEEAEAFPLASDQVIVIVRNEIFKSFADVPGYTMLVSEERAYFDESKIRITPLLQSKKKEILLDAYGFLLTENLITKESYGYDRVRLLVKELQKFVGRQKPYGFGARAQLEKSTPMVLDEPIKQDIEDVDDLEL